MGFKTRILSWIRCCSCFLLEILFKRIPYKELDATFIVLIHKQGVVTSIDDFQFVLVVSIYNILVEVTADWPRRVS